MNRKVFCALLAAGMTVVSTGVVSAQLINRETLARMKSTAGSGVAGSPLGQPRAGMRGVSTKNSLVGSWLETATFPPETGIPPLKSLVAFHDDGTMEANDQGGVNLDEQRVSSAGVGVWTRHETGRPRMFDYTQFELFSDPNNGSLIGYLKVRGTYTLSNSGNDYTGTSEAQVLDTTGNVMFSVTVTNVGQRIQIEGVDL